MKIAWARPEYRAKQALASLGRKTSPEARRKMSEAHRKRWAVMSSENRTKIGEAISLTATGSKRGPHSEETRRKISLANLGRVVSSETRMKISEGHKRTSPEARARRIAAVSQKRTPETRAKMSASLKIRWADPVYKERVIAKLHAAIHAKPNQAERRLAGLLENAEPGAWKYVGDGSLIIGGKCPDFVNVSGQKKLIELFGDYWHHGEDPAARAACFTPFGYETMIVWERELKDGNLKARLTEFCSGCN